MAICWILLKPSVGYRPDLQYRLFRNWPWCTGFSCIKLYKIIGCPPAHHKSIMKISIDYYLECHVSEKMTETRHFECRQPEVQSTPLPDEFDVTIQPLRGWHLAITKLWLLEANQTRVSHVVPPSDRTSTSGSSVYGTASRQWKTPQDGQLTHMSTCC